jgi:hypothetical protein
MAFDGRDLGDPPHQPPGSTFVPSLVRGLSQFRIVRLIMSRRFRSSAWENAVEVRRWFELRLMVVHRCNPSMGLAEGLMRDDVICMSQRTRASAGSGAGRGCGLSDLQIVFRLNRFVFNWLSVLHYDWFACDRFPPPPPPSKVCFSKILVFVSRARYEISNH